MSPPATMESLGFAAAEFAAGGISHPVYNKGAGACVLIMHELPGLAMPVVNFAERLITKGFHVFLPLLVGEPLEHATSKNIRRLCVSAEFARLASGVSAPIVDWLRALSRRIAHDAGVPCIGAIGMCLTGSFVIPLIIEPAVAAGVISQPAIPFRLMYELTGIGTGDWMSQINVSDNDLAESGNCARAARKAILLQRFSDDRLCPQLRIARIAQAFAGASEVHEYPEASIWRRVFDPPHALLTEEYDKTRDPQHPTREAFERVVDFLRLHLVAAT